MVRFFLHHDDLFTQTKPRRPLSHPRQVRRKLCPLSTPTECKPGEIFSCRQYSSLFSEQFYLTTQIRSSIETPVQDRKVEEGRLHLRTRANSAAMRMRCVFSPIAFLLMCSSSSRFMQPPKRPVQAKRILPPGFPAPAPVPQPLPEPPAAALPDGVAPGAGVIVVNLADFVPEPAQRGQVAPRVSRSMTATGAQPLVAPDVDGGSIERQARQALANPRGQPPPGGP